MTTPNPSISRERPARPPLDERTIPRRGFLTRASAAFIGVVVALIPLVPGVVFFLDPLLRRRRAAGTSDERFVRVTTTDVLEALEGRPEKFGVIQDRWDAWNYFPNQRIGNVILRKASTGPIDSPDDVLAFSDVCPHLGCTVEYKPAAPAETAFKCPCHASAFSLTGERANAIPPRDLDRLPVEIRNGNEVWVKYERFEAGLHEPRVIS